MAARQKADKKKKPNWKRISTEYITGDIAMCPLAKKYNVPITTLKDHARRERWSERRREYRQEAGIKAVKSPARAAVPGSEKIEPKATDVERIDRVFYAADLLIDRVIDVLEKEKYLDGKELSAIATAISRAKEIKHIRDALDIREQEARIKALEKENASGDADPVEICFSPEAEEASI